MPTLGEIMREEEDRLLAKAREEIAREKAAWDALSPEQKAVHVAAIEAKFAAFDDLATLQDISDENECEDDE